MKKFALFALVVAWHYRCVDVMATGTSEVDAKTLKKMIKREESCYQTVLRLS